jgi:hypothetical protein
MSTTERLIGDATIMKETWWVETNARAIHHAGHVLMMIPTLDPMTASHARMLKLKFLLCGLMDLEHVVKLKTWVSKSLLLKITKKIHTTMTVMDIAHTMIIPTLLWAMLITATAAFAQMVSKKTSTSSPGCPISSNGCPLSLPVKLSSQEDE